MREASQDDDVGADVFARRVMGRDLRIPVLPSRGRGVWSGDPHPTPWPLGGEVGPSHRGLASRGSSLSSP